MNDKLETLLKQIKLDDNKYQYFKDGKLVGDCINTEDRMVTPVPGGVGLLTRCALMENTIRASEMKKYG